MPNMITRLVTCLRGELVGEDAYGNRYYQDKTAPAAGKRRRRWVIYSAKPQNGVSGDEASRVPSMYHGWLHHTVTAFPDNLPVHAWQQEHQPNLTGTPDAYRPPGHTLQGGNRSAATGDYQAWTPE